MINFVTELLFGDCSVRFYVELGQYFLSCHMVEKVADIFEFGRSLEVVIGFYDPVNL